MWRMFYVCQRQTHLFARHNHTCPHGECVRERESREQYSNTYAVCENANIELI